MSVSHWVCEGIGIEQSELLHLLDGNKLIVLLKEAVEAAENAWEGIEGFDELSNEMKMEAVIEYIDEMDMDNKIPELLKLRDSKEVLITGTDNDGQYFLLYPPRYPWDENGGFKSQEEVVQYFYDLLRPFCREEITKEELRAVIDVDIYAHGCG